MANSHQHIIDRFFEAYQKRDMEGVKKVMAEDVKWYFLGNHPLAGIKNSLDEVIEFYDRMAKIMAKSKPKVDKLIVAENDDYLIECIHSKTNNPDGPNMDQHSSVLWTIKNGKIVEGRHFFADPATMDNYFTAVAQKEKVK